MCGICCLLRKNTDISFNDILKKSTLSNRGPDHGGSHVVSISRNASLLFGGFVLHLRGSITPQPLTDDKDNTLVWNGEVFGGMSLGEEDNDTQALFDQLTQAQSDQDILDTMTRLQGPWAFIFWQAAKKKLWFGRDVLGRRSLLWHLPENDADVFALSSVQIHHHSYQEVPSVGLYCLDLAFTDPQSSMMDSTPELIIFPWKNATWPGTQECIVPEHLTEKLYQGTSCFKTTLQLGVELPSWMPVLNNELPPLDYKPLMAETATASHDCEEAYGEYLSCVLDNDRVMKNAVEQLMDVLLKAVHRRVYNLPRKNRTVQNCNNATSKVENTDDIVEDVKRVDVSKGVDRIGEEEAMKTENTDVTANVAVLFSGGIDSTVITALADRCVPPDEAIDLINVAFEQLPKATPPQKGKKHSSKQSCDDSPQPRDRFAVPDRLTGFVALSELNPDRKWNFVEVNITQEELKEFRNQYVRHLIYPLTSVLDDSIGCAVWFAARGKGILGNGNHRGQTYKSMAKVVLCGMGADEQLAGYSRHRVRFKNHGWQGVINEVDMEMKRISARNLGRDDRIIGDHGRESRFPFLDEEVVAYLASLPIHIKADLSLPRGVGEKLILRLLALKLGLPSTAVLPKRAIQFGSRIAKIENSKEKASDVCTRLKHSCDTKGE